MNTWPEKNLMTMTGEVEKQTVRPGAKRLVESLSSGTAEWVQVRTETGFESILRSCTRKTTSNVKVSRPIPSHIHHMCNSRSKVQIWGKYKKWKTQEAYLTEWIPSLTITSWLWRARCKANHWITEDQAQLGLHCARGLENFGLCLLRPNGQNFCLMASSPYGCFSLGFTI